MRQQSVYKVIQKCHELYGYPIEMSCKLLHVARSAYHKWASGKLSQRTLENQRLAEKIEHIHSQNPDKGYRRINDDLLHDHGIHVNDKRVLRICRVKDIKSTIKYANQGCTRRAKNPQYVAENLLNRQFHADKPNEKWLTDVTEFKWYEGAAVHKIYLSAILDLYDRRIVAAVVGDSNDNPLVFKTFDKAVKANPDAHPLFHSDRGFQNSPEALHRAVINTMGDAGHALRHTGKQELTQMIVNYIRYYNTRRVQRSLGILTPMEKHELYLAA